MGADTDYFVVASFPTHDGAAFALARLKTAQLGRGNAALISRGKGNRLQIKETHDWGMGKSAVIGGLAAIVVPGIGLVGGMLAGGLLAKLVDAGFPDAALRKLGDELTPNSSVLVALIDEGQQAEAERVLREAGGTVVAGGLRADLAEQLDEQVQSGAGGTSPGESQSR